MQDQVDTLNQLDVRAAFLNSSLGMRTPRTLRTPPYHTGLNVTECSENQRSFLRKEGIIIVATVAFGMGLDKPNVRFVAHLDAHEHGRLLSETGRARRNGLPSDAWIIYGLGDVA